MTIKTTIEEINGKMMTFVWHRSHPDNIKFDYHLFITSFMPDGSLILGGNTEGKPFATALPALPRHPKPKDALLLYRYTAEGIKLVQTDEWLDYKISHAIDSETGNKIEVAIEDKENDK